MFYISILCLFIMNNAVMSASEKGTGDPRPTKKAKTDRTYKVLPLVPRFLTPEQQKYKDQLECNRKIIVSQKIAKALRWSKDCRGQVTLLHDGLKVNTWHKPCFDVLWEKYCNLTRLFYQIKLEMSEMDRKKVELTLNAVKKCDDSGRSFLKQKMEQEIIERKKENDLLKKKEEDEPVKKNEEGSRRTHRFIAARGIRRVFNN